MTLIVFSDDWGRHPTSCQHLVRRLLGRTPVVWVNTIGMRRPKLEWYTVRRGAEKFWQWFGPKPMPESTPDNLRIVSPLIWPGFGRTWERSLNRRLLERKLRPIVDAMPTPPIAVTTMPTVADLMGRLPVQRWVYYCVDDFANWPGMDHRTVEQLEAKLIDQADRIIVVSENLRERIAQRGRQAELLTHGVDLDFWKAPADGIPQSLDYPRPWLLFWGLIDRRMDIDILIQLSNRKLGTVILVGPQDNPDPRLRSLPGVVMRPAVPLEELPRLAAAADVLLLPYADLPVTRAIQPLKLKEYLATGKPVVARDLPAVREWEDCLDLTGDAARFANMVANRVAEGLPAAQTIARQRLSDESWDAKADLFYRHITTP
jgi:glycosyltransferase involved in cell wall biosynthesis